MRKLGSLMKKVSMARYSHKHIANEQEHQDLGSDLFVLSKVRILFLQQQNHPQIKLDSDFIKIINSLKNYLIFLQNQE